MTLRNIRKLRSVTTCIEISMHVVTLNEIFAKLIENFAGHVSVTRILNKGENLPFQKMKRIRNFIYQND